MADALKNCEKNQIDGIVAIGGDGTFRGATDLSNHGIPTIGIPGTIDNDITSTDYSIGFDTAMNTVLEMADRLRDTCESHARCNVIEVMGRGAGDIALLTGIASGAVATVIPEKEFDEGFAKRIQEQTGVETKFARLAHVVRGGNPTLRDRVAAAQMGEAAVNELFKGNSNLVVCEQKGEIVTVNIQYALALDKMYKNKLKDGDLDAFSEEQIAEMKGFCEEKRKYFDMMHKIADDVTK